MKPNKTPKKQKTHISVNELQTWLDGYCSAHDAGWSPTLEQWKIIKGKIFSLSDNQKPVSAPAYNPAYAPPRPESYPNVENYNNNSNGMTSIEVPTYESTMGSSTVGVSDRPAMHTRSDGVLVMPSSLDDKLPPSSFA